MASWACRPPAARRLLGGAPRIPRPPSPPRSRLRVVTVTDVSMVRLPAALHGVPCVCSSPQTRARADEPPHAQERHFLALPRLPRRWKHHARRVRVAQRDRAPPNRKPDHRPRSPITRLRERALSAVCASAGIGPDEISWLGRSALSQVPIGSARRAFAERPAGPLHPDQPLTRVDRRRGPLRQPRPLSARRHRDVVHVRRRVSAVMIAVVSVCILSWFGASTRNQAVHRR